MNISCFLIGKDTSVCVRFFTRDPETLKPWIRQFEDGPCHVHCHDYLDTVKGDHGCEDELKAWLRSSSCASAVIFLDLRLGQTFEADFLGLCAKAKTQGVFIGFFVDGDSEVDESLQKLQPNWILPTQTSREMIRKRVNEILGVVRFTAFRSGLR